MLPIEFPQTLMTRYLEKEAWINIDLTRLAMVKGTVESSVLLEARGT